MWEEKLWDVQLVFQAIHVKEVASCPWLVQWESMRLLTRLLPVLHVNEAPTTFYKPLRAARWLPQDTRPISPPAHRRFVEKGSIHQGVAQRASHVKRARTRVSPGCLSAVPAHLVFFVQQVLSLRFLASRATTLQEQLGRVLTAQQERIVPLRRLLPHPVLLEPIPWVARQRAQSHLKEATLLFQINRQYFVQLVIFRLVQGRQAARPHPVAPSSLLWGQVPRHFALLAHTRAAVLPLCALNATLDTCVRREAAQLA